MRAHDAQLSYTSFGALHKRSKSFVARAKSNGFRLPGGVVPSSQYVAQVMQILTMTSQCRTACHRVQHTRTTPKRGEDDEYDSPTPPRTQKILKRCEQNEKKTARKTAADLSRGNLLNSRSNPKSGDDNPSTWTKTHSCVKHHRCGLVKRAARRRQLPRAASRTVAVGVGVASRD